MIDALQLEGFGILSDIDVAATMKARLDVNFWPHRILGACNPAIAHQALLAEDKVGTMLPFNVVVQDAGDASVEIAAIDPVASMSAIDNPRLKAAAQDVRQELKNVVAAL